MEAQPPESADDDYRQMTVVGIRDAGEERGVEVMFSESARFYRLPPDNPDYSKLRERLQAAAEKNDVVGVFLSAPGGDVIRDVATQ